MVWIVIAALAVMVTGLLLVVRDAEEHERQNLTRRSSRPA
jgi:hypothetical protein